MVSLNLTWQALVMFFGLVLVAYAVWPTAPAQQGAMGLGLAVLVCSLVFSAKSPAGPAGPLPPLPDDRVVPVTTFEAAVAAAFTGTKAEAQTIAAIADQFADNVQFDGTRDKPVIQTTSDLGAIWAETQRVTFTAEATPLKAKFAPVANLVIAELERKGISTGATKQFDATMRAAAVRVWKQLAAAMTQAKGA